MREESDVDDERTTVLQPPPHLFERLAQLPGFTWDTSLKPFHSSYDHWHVLGTQHISSGASATSSLNRPSSNKSSPKIPPHRPSLRYNELSHESTSERSSSRQDGERTTIPIVARISKHLLRIEREFYLFKSFMQNSDPNCSHIGKIVDMFKLPGRAGGEKPLMVVVFEFPGGNALKDLIDFGPAWIGMPRSQHGLEVTGGLGMASHNVRDQVSIPVFLEFAIGACECIELMHHGIRVVHGELRPDAFHYLREAGEVRLVNFGSGPRAFENAFTSSGWFTLSQELGIKHKLQFIAPEQTGRMPAEPDSRTDIYSLGVLFWTMLIAKPPFEGETPLDVIQAVLSKKLPPLTAYRIDVPDAISRMIRRMTQKQIEERYHSVSGIKHDLVEIQRLMGEGDVEGLANYRIRSHDVSSFFVLPTEQFGRAEEHAKILEAAKHLAGSHRDKHPTYLDVVSTSASTASERYDNFEAMTRSSDTSSLSLSRRESATSPALRARRPSRVYEDNLTNGKTLDTNETALSNDSQRLSQSTRGQPTRRHAPSRKRRRCEVISVLGSAGLGKTSLVQKTHAEIRKIGYFASAKFDPARKTPFEPLLFAMGALLRQIFSESDVETAYHNMVRTNLRTIWPAVSSMLNLPETLLYTDRTKKPGPLFNRSVQNEIVGDNSSINSSQSGVVITTSDFCHGGANPRSTKFISIFVEVLRVLSTNKLICLCLDDLHLADDESLDLLSNIISKRLGIMLQLTCRSEGTTLSAAVQNVLNHSSANTLTINLKPLSEKEVVHFVAAVLRRPCEYVYPLGIVCLEKSNGNPFYLRQMLEMCNQKGCVWYSWKASSWDFDLDRVFAEFSTESHTDQQINSNFISRRFQSDLPSATRSVLGWASLLGISFSFSMVQRLLSGEFDYVDEKNGVKQGPCKATAHLFTPLAGDNAVEGLQFAVQCYILTPGGSEDEFSFSHDRYLHAAASLRECQRVDKMHFIIAQTMLKYPDTDLRSVYDRAQHICQALTLLRHRVKQRRPYRDILVEAAEKAVAAGARPSALQYYEAALALLQPSCWADDADDCEYTETLNIHLKAAELYWYQSHFSQAQNTLAFIFANARSPVDKAPAWVFQSKLFAQNGNFTGAFASLKTSLLELGLQFNTDPTWEEVDNEFVKLRDYIQAQSANEVLNIPFSEERNILAMGQVFVEAISSAYWTNNLVCYSMCVRMVEMHFNGKGTFTQAGLGFAFGAMSCALRLKDVEFGQQLSDYSHQFLLKQNDPFTLGRGLGVSTLFTRHLMSPIRQHAHFLEEALDYAIVGGDKNLIHLAIGGIATMKLSVGEDMTEIESYCTLAPEDYSADLYSDFRGGVFLTGVRQATRALLGKTWTDTPELVMSDESHSTKDFCAWVEEKASSNVRPRMIYGSFMVLALYSYGHYDLAIQWAAEIWETYDTLWSLRLIRLGLFYGALSLSAKARQEPSQKEELLATALQYKEEIDGWQKVCDANYLMWSLAIQAEVDDVREEFHSATQNYEKALDHAQLYDFNLELAVILELQADFFIRRGARRGARSAILDAMSAYSRINANGKVRYLAAKHEWILSSSSNIRAHDVGVQTIDHADSRSQIDESERRDERVKAWVDPRPTESGRTDVSNLGLDVLDLQGILEFNQAISSELQLDKLLTKMIQLIHESAGTLADFAAVVIENENEWSVAVSATADGISSDPRPISELRDETQRTVLMYTMRFKELVFIHNLALDDRFSNLRSNKSVVSIPIFQGKEMLGVLYLEGDPNAFTDRNLGVLQLFCNQVGISIANALLFRQIAKVSASNASMVETQRLALAKAREAEIKAKAAEAEAMENVRLKEEAAKAKSLFLANVSHELRTPLNGVIGMAELLKQSKLNKEQDGYADSIRVCADTLLTVINDILDFSRLEAGRMKLFSVPLNLRETITEVVRALSYTNLEKGLQTKEELDLDPNLLVTGDPVRLHQIFMNLLNNSYKFTAKGSVTIRAKTDVDTPDYVKVTCSVQDTGIGITQEQVSRLFTPFSQADSSTQRSYGGSGLGLSICKSLIDVLNGKIWLESQLGKGTTVSFTLKFPKAAKANEPSPNKGFREQDPMATWSSDTTASKGSSAYPDLTKIPKDKIRICIAEDNPINQKIAISFVKKLGFTCEAFGDGQQAVEAMRKASKEHNHFHITLMDVQMPVLDGYDATRLIRKDSDPNVKNAVVIAMTASAIRGDREKCLEAGMNDYLAKPVRAAVLKTMLDEYLTKPPPPAASKDGDDEPTPTLTPRDTKTDRGTSGSRPTSRNGSENSRPTFGQRMSSRNDIPYYSKSSKGTLRPTLPSHQDSKEKSTGGSSSDHSATRTASSKPLKTAPSSTIPHLDLPEQVE